MAQEFQYSTLRNDANLKAYWRLDSVNDALGTYNLTNNGSVTFSAAQWGNGANFGAANSTKYLNWASDNAGIDGTSLSWSCWVKCLAEIGSGTWAFVDQESAGTKTQQRIYYDYNGGTRRISFARVRSGTIEESVLYNITMGTSATYHLVYTYDGTNINAYINGASVGTATASGAGSAVTTPGLGIGATEAATRFSSTLIDDVALFNRALTAAEVSLLYNLTPTNGGLILWG